MTTDHKERITSDHEGLSNVHIECPDGLPHSTSIKVGGVPIVGVVEARWEVRLGRLATAYLVLEGVSVDVMSEYAATRIYGLKNPPKEAQQ